MDDRRVPERKLLRADRSRIFRRDLTEENNDDRQDSRRDADRRASEETHRKCSRQRRRGEVHDIVADKNRGQHLRPLVENLHRRHRPFISLIGPRLDRGLSDHRQCRLCGRKKCGQRNERSQNHKIKNIFHTVSAISFRMSINCPPQRSNSLMTASTRSGRSSQLSRVMPVAATGQLISSVSG